jgi:hypothetical protein
MTSEFEWRGIFRRSFSISLQSLVLGSAYIEFSYLSPRGDVH